MHLPLLKCNPGGQCGPFGKHLPDSSLSCRPNPCGHLPLGKQLPLSLCENPGGQLPFWSGLHLGDSGWNAQPLSGIVGFTGLTGGPMIPGRAGLPAGGPGLGGPSLPGVGRPVGVTSLPGPLWVDWD